MFEVLFQYGPFIFRTFNLFLVVAFLLGMIFLVRYVSRHKMRVSFVVNHFVFLGLAGFLGGRILEGIEHFSFYRETPLQLLVFWDFKISEFGFFYGVMAALYFLTRHARENFWSWFDAFILSGLVGLIFIHVGHFFDGGEYGLPTELPWGIAFDIPSIPFTTPLHPTSLYSALFTFLVFSYVMKFNRRTHLAGMAGNLSLLLYSLGALSIDFLHGLPSTYHKISFAVIAVIAFIFLIHCSHQTYYQNTSD